MRIHHWKKKLGMLLASVCLAGIAGQEVCRAEDVRDGWDAALTLPAAGESRSRSAAAGEPEAETGKSARWTDIELGLAEIVLTERDTAAYSNVGCDYILVLDRTRTMALNDTSFQGGASQDVNSSHSPCLNRDHYYEYNGEQVNLYDYANGEVRGSGEYRSFPADARLYNHHRNAQGQAIRPDASNGCIDRMALAKQTLVELISQIEEDSAQVSGAAKNRVSYWSFAGTYWPEADGELDTDLEKGLFNYVPLTTDYARVKSSVEQTMVYAGTYYQNSFQRIYEQLSARSGERKDAPAKVIFISDGKCADNHEEIQYWNNQIRRIPGCTVYTLAIGMQASSEEAAFLRELSTNRDSTTFAAFVTNLHSEDPAFAQTLTAIRQAKTEVKATEKVMYDTVETDYWEILEVQAGQGSARAEGGTVVWEIPEGAGQTYECRVKIKLKDEYRYQISDTRYPTNRDGQAKGCRLEYTVRGGSSHGQKRTVERETPVLPYGAVSVSGEKYWTVAGSEAPSIQLSLARRLEGQEAELLLAESQSREEGWQYSFDRRQREDGAVVPLVLCDNSGNRYTYELTEETDMYECIRVEEGEPAAGQLVRNLYNRPFRIKARLAKTDAQTGVGLEGAVFAVLAYDRDTDSYLPYTGTEDSMEGGSPVYLKDRGDGWYESEGWLYYSEDNEGRFRLVEEQAPWGYVGSRGGQGESPALDIQITEDNHGTVVEETTGGESLALANTRVTGTICLAKVDADSGLAVPQGQAALFYEDEEKNARYGLFAGEDILAPDTGEVLFPEGTLVQDGRVGSEGTLVFRELELGTYVVRELEDAPEGYLLDSRDYQVTLDYEGQDVPEVEESLTAYEPVKKQRQVIYKMTGEGDQMEWLDGAGFSVFPVESLTEIAWDGRDDGELAEAVKETYLGREGSGYAGMRTLAPLVLYEDGEAWEVGELTGEGGVIETPPLPYGVYVIVETTVPSGKTPVDPLVLRIQGDDSDRDVLGDGKGQKRRALLLRDSDRLSRLVIRKVEEGGKEALAGAAYRVRDVDGAWKEWYFQSATLWEKAQYELFHDGYVVCRDAATGSFLGTEENPWVTQPAEEPYGCAAVLDTWLPCGTYELEEVKAPDGYILQGEEGQIARKEAYEEGNGTFYETEEEGMWTRTPSEAVRFQIAEEDMEYDGKSGAYYTVVVQENTRPVGKLSVYIEGEKLEDNGQGQEILVTRPQEGAVFRLEAAEDIFGAGGKLAYRAGDLVEELVSDAQGKAWTGGTDDAQGRPKGLLPGEYRLTQVKAGEGFPADSVDAAWRTVSIAYVDERTPVIYRDEVYTMSEEPKGQAGEPQDPSSASPAQAEQTPKTGDPGAASWLLAAAVSGGVLLVLGRKRRKS